ncbi:unnamed protein product, partial [Amoebophrya sp. A25]|eukprot:GSA25T00001240001.1
MVESTTRGPAIRRPVLTVKGARTIDALTGQEVVNAQNGGNTEAGSCGRGTSSSSSRAQQILARAKTKRRTNLMNLAASGGSSRSMLENSGGCSSVFDRMRNVKQRERLQQAEQTGIAHLKARQEEVEVEKVRDDVKNARGDDDDTSDIKILAGGRCTTSGASSTSSSRPPTSRGMDDSDAAQVHDRSDVETVDIVGKQHEDSRACSPSSPLVQNKPSYSRSSASCSSSSSSSYIKPSLLSSASSSSIA